MTIYAVGSEEGPLQPYGRAAFVTTASTFDSSFARGSIKIFTHGEAYLKLSSDLGANSSVGYWVHFTYAVDNSSTFNGNMLVVYDSQDRPSCSLTATSNNLIVRVYDSTGSYSSYDTGQVLGKALTLNRIDVHVYQSGSDAKAEVFVDGVSWGTATRAGQTNLGAYQAQFFYNMSFGAAFGAHVSEVIIADESTVGMRVKTLPPTSDGFHADWNGSYTAIDEYTSDVDAVRSNAVGGEYSYGIGGLTGLEAYSVKAVVMDIFAGCDGTNDLQMLVRKASTDYLSSSLGAFEGVTYYTNIWNQDPATASDWVNSDIANLEFGVKSV